jgi:hypothetical protein
MHPYDIEALVSGYPKGGVAPLRHKLATYEYVERQRQYLEQVEPIDVTSVLQAAIERTSGLVMRLFAWLALPFGSER